VEVEVRRHDHRDRLVRLHVRLDLRARRCRGREREPRHHPAAEPPEPESQLVAAGQAQVAVAAVYSARQ
jgi:hypothetical protein